MEKRDKTKLTTRLEGLSLQFPNCPWMKDFLELSRTMKTGSVLEIIIDNDYIDTNYTVLASEN